LDFGRWFYVVVVMDVEAEKAGAIRTETFCTLEPFLPGFPKCNCCVQ
jgi:hypothetical protein